MQERERKAFQKMVFAVQKMIGATSVIFKRDFSQLDEDGTVVKFRRQTKGGFRFSPEGHLVFERDCVGHVDDNFTVQDIEDYYAMGATN